MTRRTVQHQGNGPRAALDSAAVAKGGSAKRQSEGRIQGVIAKRAAAATEHALDGPNQKPLLHVGADVVIGDARQHAAA